MKAKFLMVLAAGLLTSATLAGCGEKGDKPVVVVDAITSITLDKTSVKFVEEGDSATLTATLSKTGDPDTTVTWSSSNPSVATVDSDGKVTAVASEGTAVITASCGGKSATCVIGFYEAANGAFNYSNLDYDVKTAITGALEKWAVDNLLTGITVFEDGGWNLTNTRVEKGAPAYIKGYGFGTLAEGRLTAPLAAEEESQYKMYYHTYESSDPAKILYMDDDGGVVSGLVGYCSGAYYDIIMDETRTSYEWVHDLATNDEPVAVNPDADGASTVYRFPVKTGSAAKYSTLTKNSNLTKYNNREIALEDYITPYKVYYTKAYGMRRNSEIKDKNSGSIKGGEAYVKASSAGFNEEEWAKVGIKSGHSEELGDYIEFTLNQAVTPFWARYYLGGSMFAPVPEDFLKDLGGGNLADGIALWGKFDNTATLSPVDTFLSTGPYVLKEWVKDSKITYARNPNYVYGEDPKTTRPSHYYIEGVYIDVITALDQDNEAALKKFEAGKLDSCGVPSTKLSDYTSDPRATLIPGETTTKLNLNTCTAEQWEQLFGEHGSITQTPTDSYWDVEPAMANKAFVNGLSYAIDRLTYASKLGRTPSSNYFGSGYYANPEEALFYNDTPEHEAAVAEFLDGTEYGYSLEKAKLAFKQATEELIAEGYYSEGDTISIEIAWQASSQENTYAKPLAKMIEDAFNASGSRLNLEITHWYPKADYSEVYYDKMMVGQFDIGFGGIEGNAFDPLNFFEVLKSDNSSSFTLNWGADTSKVDPLNPIIYDDGTGAKAWSFDGLWEVADHGGIVENGVKIDPVKSCYSKRPTKLGSDTERINDLYNGYRLTVPVEFADNGDGSVEFDFSHLDVYVFNGGNIELSSDKAVYDKVNKVIVIDVDATTAQQINQAIKVAQNFKDEDITKPDDQWKKNPFVNAQLGKLFSYELYYSLAIKGGAASVNYYAVKTSAE